ncbi:hypothetical protein [Arthrobacter cryoconiti]|uniref:Rifampin ADP-ribosyl transferase n=1 Tax=Arthrobacter cryoconiti TaxID=748907 RepID=A0ABV8QWN7_9MICC|nr:hypothetical protein [Arthrobacter cryoconiti]MCC9068835.1 hypothetical protein [Arthrobacter cryoconiti]
MNTYFHGGVDGLRPGDLLEPGHSRKQHDGCEWCAARAIGETHLGIDGPSERSEVYFTPNRLYAKFHASLYGYGDLYRVEPVGTVTRSTEDTMESYTAPTARVTSVLERAVELTWPERRRLNRHWADADKTHRLNQLKTRTT